MCCAALVKSAMALCVCIAGIGQAGQSTDQAVERLLTQLATGSAEERQAAENALVEYGPSIVPQLKARLGESDDPETRTRFEAVLARLADQGSFAATIVSLDLNGVTPRQAFEELFRQAGAPSRIPQGHVFGEPPDGGAPTPGITLSLHRVDFWTAFMSLARLTHTNVTVDDGILQLVPREAATPPHVLAGPAIVFCDSVTRVSRIDHHRPGATRSSLDLDFSLLLEPRALPHGTDAGTVDVLSVLDERGNPITPTGVESESEGSVIRFRISLPLQPDPGTRLGLLRVRAVIPLVTEFTVDAFDDLFATPSPTRALLGGVLALDHVDVSDPHTPLVRLRFSPPDTPQSDWLEELDALLGSMQLVDAHGKTLSVTGTRLVGNDPDESCRIDLRFSHPDDQQPVEIRGLRWRVVRSTRTLNVPFEFRDLPLPAR